MRRPASSFVLAGALGVAGCVPFPHDVRTQPDVDGVLRADGVPLAGVEVRGCLANPGQRPEDCEKRAAAVTDAQGRFHLAGERHLVPMMMLAGDWYWSWGITTTLGDRRTSWGVTGGEPPEHVDLDCTWDTTLTCRWPRQSH